MGKPHAALLRGINLGPSTRIAMADLRALFESLGHTNVRTLLNSGNVVFTPGRGAARDEAARLEKAIAAKLGVRTDVMVMSAAEVAEAVDAEPFGPAAREPSRRLIVVLRDAKAKSRVRDILAARWAPERIAAGRRVLYLYCTGGLHKSPVWSAVIKAMDGAATARNLATMTKIRTLLEAG